MNMGNIMVYGTNGVVGADFTVNKVNYNSSEGILEVDVLYRPHIALKMITIDVSYINVEEIEKREKVYKKRNYIIKKLLS